MGVIGWAGRVGGEVGAAWWSWPGVDHWFGRADIQTVDQLAKIVGVAGQDRVVELDRERHHVGVNDIGGPGRSDKPAYLVPLLGGEGVDLEGVDEFAEPVLVGGPSPYLGDDWSRHSQRFCVPQRCSNEELSGFFVALYRDEHSGIENHRSYFWAIASTASSVSVRSVSASQLARNCSRASSRCVSWRSRG